MKRHILVVGYPKSGSTWLTRLTAELLIAPVVGFWNELHPPNAHASASLLISASIPSFTYSGCD